MLYLVLEFHSFLWLNNISFYLYLYTVVVQLLSHVWFFATHELQHARLPCPSLSPRVCSNLRPLSQWCYLTISSSAAPFSFAFNISHHHSLFQWVGSSHQVTKVLELQLQYQSFQWIFRLISFRTEWFVLLTVQGTLKSLLQHHNSKAYLRLPAYHRISYLEIVNWVKLSHTVCVVCHTHMTSLMCRI